MKGELSAPSARGPQALLPLSNAGKVLGAGLLLWAAEQLAAVGFERNVMVMTAVQAAIVVWGAGRLEVASTGGQPAALPTSAMTRLLVFGAALGFGCAAATVAVSLVVKEAVVVRAEPAPAMLLIGVVIAGLGAVRDELLLRGVVLRASRFFLPVPAALLFCGLAAASARFGADQRLSGRLALEGLRGVALGGLWVRDRGAWMACAANAGWTWATGPILCGGLFDVRFASGSIVGGSSLALFGIVAAAMLWATPKSIHPWRFA